jgi:hypothetical protein
MPSARRGARNSQAYPILHGSAPGAARYCRGQGTPRLLGSGLSGQATLSGKVLRRTVFVERAEEFVELYPVLEVAVVLLYGLRRDRTRVRRTPCLWRPQVRELAGRTFMHCSLLMLCWPCGMMEEAPPAICMRFSSAASSAGLSGCKCVSKLRSSSFSSALFPSTSNLRNQASICSWIRTSICCFFSCSALARLASLIDPRPTEADTTTIAPNADPERQQTK